MVDISRFIQVFIGEGIALAFCIFLSYKILRKDRTRKKKAFAEFYLLVSIGLILNVIYVALTNYYIVMVLNFICMYFIFFAPISLVNFCLMLFYDEEKYDSKKQLILRVIYGIVLFCMIFVPNGVIIDCSSGECTPPLWSIPFFLYHFIVMTIFTFIPVIYFSIRILEKFDDEQLKKKWKFFILGIICLYIFMYGSIFSNTPAFADVLWAPIGLIFVLIGIYLVYYGVAKGF